MNASPRIRVMRESDLPFADSLRAIAGWNQTLDDWRRFLAMQPEGCFLAEWGGVPAGTAATVVYELNLAWIGMALVHPEFRRRGIGRALLLRCIEYLRGLNMKRIKLDATPEGRLVYEKLGFKEEWSLRRWEAVGGIAVREGDDYRLRDWIAADAAHLASLDRRAFGASRRELITALASQSRCALTCEGEGDTPTGYGLLRPGARAFYLGPVVSNSPRDGLALVQALAARAGAARIYWDIPDANLPAVEWAERHGFAVQRILTRMRLGENRLPGNPLEQFAIAGPELG